MKHLFLSFFALILVFTVHAQAPGPIIGSMAICSGSTTALTDAVTPGTWTSSDPAVASIGPFNGVVTGASPGTATITYTSLGGSITAVVTVNASPNLYTVIGGGVYCAGGSGIHVGLSSSDVGCNYQLYIGSAAVGTAVAGAGGAMDFGLVATVGIYNVIATSTITGCTKTMTGSISVVVNPTPAAFSVTGGGVCGPHIGLSGSSAGIQYQLFLGGTPLGLYFTGMGAALDFGSHSALGTYTAIATNTLTGCTAAMAGSATVTAVTGIVPAIYGPSTICIGTPALLSDTMMGGTWYSSNTSVATIDAFGSIIGISSGTTIITYSLGAGCDTFQAISVVPAVCTGTPTAGSPVFSEASACPGDVVHVGLSGSSAPCGLSYQWQSSPDGTTFTDIAGATGSIYTVTFTSTKFYRSKVTCTSTGLFSYSSPGSIPVRSTITSHSVTTVTDTSCSSPDFYINVCGGSSSLNVTTWFGDGSFVNTALISGGSWSGSIAHVHHSYSTPGTYGIKQVVYNGTSPQDSVSFSYEYLYCNTLPIKFYYDVNNDCVRDSGDVSLLAPVRIEVDSNGVAVDTICTTSGLYYRTHAPAGTVYRFHAFSIPDGLHLTCPTSGMVYDTISATVNDYYAKYVGLNCASGGSFDITQHVSTQTGRHMQTGHITVSNSYCTGVPSTVVMTFSPQYHFTNATPSPVSVVGNVVTWDVAAVSSGSSAMQLINYQLDVPLTWLIPGDTVLSTYLSSALIIGDVDTTNNHNNRCDTVKSSYDPNEMSVLPAGYILPCTKLQYTVNFENTGNDTAHNIAVMDTLDDNLDPHSLNVEIASSVMNIAFMKESGHTVVKFDFPAINLPDSSHHNQCNGLVIFNIKTKPGLATGTHISNHAGIFFDDNPVVMTDTATNVIGLPTITGAANVCAGANTTLSAPAGFTGGTWSSSGAGIASVGTGSGVVSGIAVGSAVITYSVASSCGSAYTSHSIIVNPLPATFSVIGGGSYCAGGTGVHVGLSGSAPGVNYFLFDGALGAGSVSGTGGALDFGFLTVAGTYTVKATDATTTCNKYMTDSAVVTILPDVVPSLSVITSPGDTVCAGSLTTFTPALVSGGSSPVYTWMVNGIAVSAADIYSYVPANGDIISLTVTSDAPCAVPSTVNYSVTMVVDNTPVPTVGITASPGTSINLGDPVTFTAMVTGSAVTYQWQLNGMDIPGATDATYTNSVFANGDTVTCIATATGICGGATSRASAVITVMPAGVKQISGYEGVSIVPNPNNGVFTISGMLNTPDAQEITISNMLGQVIYRDHAEVVNGKIAKEVRLDQSLPRGVYMLLLSSQGGSRVYHFSVD